MIWNTIWIENATKLDATWIAQMSRDKIEYGLKWSWTPERVLQSINASNTAVAKASIRTKNVGFGIMTYRKEKANLNLLAVNSTKQRSGIGKKILESLEKTAFDQGIENFYVQIRETNFDAQEFYKTFGYEMIDRNKTYYQQKEPGVIFYKYCPS